jgi:hypothetical protein
MMNSHFSYCMPHLKSIPDDGFTFLIMHASSPVYSTWWIHILHIACLISSIFHLMDSHFSYCMPHLKYIPPDGFTFFILHDSSQVYSRWWIHIFHTACLISSLFHLMYSHFPYCMPHIKSIPDDVFTIFILHSSSQVYFTWWIHIFHNACLISSLFHLMDSHFTYCMSHLKYIPPDGFTLSYCMPHFKSIPPDGPTFFILHASSQVYSTWWIHIFILHASSQVYSTCWIHIFTLHASFQVHSTWWIHIFHIEISGVISCLHIVHNY